MRRACLAGLALALLASGCTSHEARFESSAPPREKVQPKGVELERIAALGLIRRYRSKVGRLAPESLACLTKASALLFEATGSTEFRDSTHRFADALLRRRLRYGYDYTRDGEPPRADAGVTAAAGTSLIDAFLATGRQRYRREVVSLVRLVQSRRLGWKRTREGYAIRTNGAPDTLDVASTAQVGQFLDHFGRAMQTPVRRSEDRLPRERPVAQAVIRWIAASQPAVGRWYGAVATPRPQSAREWPTTLLDLALIGGDRAEGILGAGVPALWRAMFFPDGRARRPPNTRAYPEGIPIALSAFEEWKTSPRYADFAYVRALRSRRPDYTASFAAADDSLAQSYFALALARRVYHAAQLARP